MSSAFTRFRAFVFIVVVLSFSVVPAATAAPRKGEPPRFERIGRVVAKLLKTFGIGSNSDAVIMPRP